VNPFIIEVPSRLGLRPSGVEAGPGALRKAGLHARLGSAAEVCIDVPPYCDVRDPETGVLNPQGVAAVARDLAAAVDTALDSHRFPIVLGGDCSILLGPMLSLRRRGRYGLVFIDGHADFQHPSDEPNGEVASLDLALVTGRGPEMLADLDGLGPLVRDEDAALIGYRVFGDNDQFLGEHVRHTAATVIDLPEVRERGTADAVRKALSAASRPGAEGFWVHLDVDVLDDDLMPAVDYRHPGGIGWEEAADILRGLLGAKGARGIDVTIFNPHLDRDGGLAQRLSGLIAGVVPVSGMR
jgi:arginase